ncbi:MAG TPA: sugar phosphate nucleotidyltransferase [Gaiellaceae bacterium]|nr:sugar phosphate nucleotidyltransferase [Gaiellaceae bacterium]
MEAIVLAGGKAERLGEAAAGRPKALVPVAGRPLAAYQVEALAAAGVRRVLVSCAAGAETLFEEALAGLGPEIVPVGEPEPLGRGGGLRFAAAARRAEGDVFALNGDELLDLDLAGLLSVHRAAGAAATITVVPLPSAFGVVDVGEDDVVTGFREAPRLPFWASCGVYVLGEEALARLPERGDHERTTFPELAAERRLRAFRHEGVWLTVNTPKDLRVAEEYLARHPGGLTPVHPPR